MSDDYVQTLEALVKLLCIRNGPGDIRINYKEQVEMGAAINRKPTVAFYKDTESLDIVVRVDWHDRED